VGTQEKNLEKNKKIKNGEDRMRKKTVWIAARDMVIVKEMTKHFDEIRLKGFDKIKHRH
jgi:translation initiation factor IF-1